MVLGVGATLFGRHADTAASELAGRAAIDAVEDAGLTRGDVGAVFYATVSQKAIDRQHMIPGQIALKVIVEGVGKSGNQKHGLAPERRGIARRSDTGGKIRSGDEGTGLKLLNGRDCVSKIPVLYQGNLD